MYKIGDKVMINRRTFPFRIYWDSKKQFSPKGKVVDVFEGTDTVGYKVQWAHTKMSLGEISILDEKYLMPYED